MGNPQTAKSTEAEEEIRQSMETVLKARCQAFGAPVAIVGTQSAAVLLLNVLQNADIPLAGIYEKALILQSFKVWKSGPGKLE